MVFLVSIEEKCNQTDSNVNLAPTPRSHSGLAFKHNTLFLYGGIVEKGSKSITLNDFYSLGKFYFIY